MKNLLMASSCFLLMTATVAAEESSSVSVGKAAPDFTVIGIDGKPLKLSELTAKDKHVVLLFDRAHW